LFFTIERLSLECEMFKNLWLKYYWLLGYQSRLYDWLTPESYCKSLEKAIACIDDKKGKVWLDVGCGSGLLFDVCAKELLESKKIFATDILESGIRSANRKAFKNGLKEKAGLFRSDMKASIPLRNKSIDIAVAHFSLYTIQSKINRMHALENIRQVLKDGGLCAVVNPSKEYDGRRIIRDSLQISFFKDTQAVHWFKKWMLYPIAYTLGLKNIERRLHEGLWKSYTVLDLCEEMKTAGFEIVHTEKVYASSGILVLCRTAGEQDRILES